MNSQRPADQPKEYWDGTTIYPLPKKKRNPKWLLIALAAFVGLGLIGKAAEHFDPKPDAMASTETTQIQVSGTATATFGPEPTRTAIATPTRTPAPAPIPAPVTTTATVAPTTAAPVQCKVADQFLVDQINIHLGTKHLEKAFQYQGDRGIFYVMGNIYSADGERLNSGQMWAGKADIVLYAMTARAKDSTLLADGDDVLPVDEQLDAERDLTTCMQAN